MGRLRRGLNARYNRPSLHLFKKLVYFSGTHEASDQFGFSFRPNASKLLNVDISGTFTEAPDYFKQQFRNEQTVSLLNTGRSLEYLQSSGKLKDLKLADAVVDFLATDNGTTLYWNKDRLALGEWIPGLTPEYQVSKFKTTMEGSFNSSPQEIKDNVLLPISEAFKSRYPDLDLVVKFKPEIKTKCTVMINDTQAKALQGQFRQALQDRLDELKIKAEVREELRPSSTSGSGLEIKYTIAPDGYSKLSPIEFILNAICTQVKEVESYGNNLNDLAVVSRPNILARNHSCHIIPSGSNTPSLRESLKGKNHIRLWDTIQDFLHHLLK